uniref:Uncharacterized protein n=1 Tax=Vombatus ursinus TaxID=29139 RepID=A0A4X2KGU7_VOMUR
VFSNSLFGSSIQWEPRDRRGKVPACLIRCLSAGLPLLEWKLLADRNIFGYSLYPQHLTQWQAPSKDLVGLQIRTLSFPDTQEQDEQLRLQRELDWCVEQLELGLRTQKSTPRQAEQAARAIKTLRSHRAELPKKRQVMRSLFGDYRTRMEEDRKTALKAMEAAARSARMLPVEEAVRRKSSRVCRHRPGGGMSSVPSPKEEFRFNFF